VTAAEEPAAPLDPALRLAVLQRHRDAAIQLLAEAFEAWRSAGFDRFNDLEASCTVRIFDCLTRLIHARLANDDWAVMASYEEPLLTRDQLEGRADPTRAKRPDLRLLLFGGRGGVIHVESKRLLGGANGAEYVSNGMGRFVRGQYPTDSGLGAMLGYEMEISIADRVVEINAAVDGHADLGTSHRLRPEAPLGPIADVHRSDHNCAPAQVFSLIHMFAEVA
jgi:hypothetical protein